MQISTHVIPPDSSTAIPHTAPQEASRGDHDLRDALMALARRPGYGVTIALAGVIANSWETNGPQCLPLYGLDVTDTRDVLEDHFPGASALLGRSWKSLEMPLAFMDMPELDALVEMLVDSRTVEDEDSRRLAHAITTACIGDRQLWEDLGMGSRERLDELMLGFFTSLAVRNRQGLYWKQFFYLQLCERSARALYRPHDEDYRQVFGPESGY